MKGKLISIEGTDGSGKTTQLGLLKDYLAAKGRGIQCMKFPQHQTPFFGNMVDQYLNGEFGHASTVHPKLASLLFAFDRWEAKPTIQGWLDAGEIVILDRYTSANKAHQAGKIKDPEERDAFLQWIDESEYRVLGLPRPDLVLFLDVPPEHNLRLMESRGEEGKDYIKGKKDQHESDPDHLRNTHQAYSYVADRHDYWKRIACTQDGALLPIESIHDKVIKAIETILDA